MAKKQSKKKAAKSNPLELEPGFWYVIGKGEYKMIDPVTGGVWLFQSVVGHSQESLNEILNFHFTFSDLKRPERGLVSALRGGLTG